MSGRNEAKQDQADTAGDWRAERRRALADARCVVVKVGSAVLTTGEGLDLAMVESLAAQLSALQEGGRRVVLVSSGAVAAGRGVLRSRCEISGMPHRQAASAIGQSRLMHYYDEAFARRGRISAQVLLTRDDLKSRNRFLNARNTFAALLDWGAIPVVNENDTVAVHDLKFGDNDCLASLLLNIVEADLFVNLTSAGGVFAENPQDNPGACVMDCIDDVHGLDLDGLCGGKTSVGTGGMYSKLLSARRAAQIGVATLIVPGREPDVLTRAFAGEEIGTWVRADARTVSRRKYWLAYQSDPAGTVPVDEGAARAPLQGGKNLLPGGVCAGGGGFGSGALVRVAAQDGTVIGVGLSNYAAAELRRIMGHKRHEVAAILGDAHYPEVIHRDNLLLDAVV
jgi:glutamate 5-kinase